MEMQLVHLIESAATAPAQFLIASLWQGGLLALTAWAGLEAWPAVQSRLTQGRLNQGRGSVSKIAPRTRFLLWMIVLVLAAAIPFSSFLPGPARSIAAVAPRAVYLSAPMSALSLSAVWAVAILGVWALTSVVCLARLFVNAWRLRRLAQRAEVLPLETLGSELRAKLETPGMRRVELRVSGEIDGPAAAGFFHPAILIPGWLLEKLAPAELEQIAVHELAHLRRHDDWTNLLQKFLCALFPLNPALLWVERRLCREREMACDDAVLDAAVSPREYASCLTTLAEKRLLHRMQSLAPGAWRRRSDLAERIHRILRHKNGRPTHRSRSLVGGFLMLYLCAAVVLAHCPRLVAFVPTREGAGAAHAPEMHAAAKFPAVRATDALGGAHVVEAAFRTPAAARIPSRRTRPVAADFAQSTSHTSVKPEDRARAGSAAQARATLAAQRIARARSQNAPIVFAVWESSPEDFDAVVETTVVEPADPRAVPETETGAAQKNSAWEEASQDDVMPIPVLTFRSPAGWIVFEL
jgi:beta-lactamase regulating signal transducer with metallopeptidase domain